jgi:hypothetical protein
MSDLLLAAPIPPDGRLQAWRNHLVPPWVLQTRWKATSDPNSQWTTPWAPFDPQPGPPIALPFIDMTAGVLSDGRTQFWGVDRTGVVYTTWKVSTAHDSLWTNWSKFDTTAIPSPIRGIAVAALPDKRLQLFILNLPPGTWTSWKTTIDSNSAWTNFSAF